MKILLLITIPIAICASQHLDDIQQYCFKHTPKNEKLYKKYLDLHKKQPGFLDKLFCKKKKKNKIDEEIEEHAKIIFGIEDSTIQNLEKSDKSNEQDKIIIQVDQNNQKIDFEQNDKIVKKSKKKHKTSKKQKNNKNIQTESDEDETDTRNPISSLLYLLSKQIHGESNDSKKTSSKAAKMSTISTMLITGWIIWQTYTNYNQC